MIASNNDGVNENERENTNKREGERVGQSKRGRSLIKERESANGRV